MNHKAIALALATAISMTLTSCGSVTHETKVTSKKLYKATMYSGGSIVREWHEITYYSSYGNVGVKIYFNDEIDEIGTTLIGEVVVEPEDGAEK